MPIQLSDSLIDLAPRRPTRYVSRARTVLATGVDGFISDESAHGLWCFQGRALSLYRWIINGKAPELTASSNIEQHDWLGYYIASPKDCKQTETHECDPAQQTIELKLMRVVGHGFCEDVTLTNYTQIATVVQLDLEVEADFADPGEAKEGKRRQKGTLNRTWADTQDGWPLVFDYRVEHRFEHQGEKGTAQMRRAIKGIVQVRDEAVKPKYYARKIRFTINLAPHQSWRARIVWCIAIEDEWLPTVCALGSSKGKAIDWDIERLRFLDDYRLDAVKFPYPEFIARFTHTMGNYLTTINRPSPYIVGEWSNGGVGDTKSLRFANDYDVFGTNILDFQLSFRLNRFIGGDYEVDGDHVKNKISGFDLDSFLHQRVSAFNGRDTWQGTFLDNHDQIRTMVRLQKLGVNDETERRQRMDLGIVLLMTVRGIPIIYYGDEQYLAHYNDGNLTPPEYVNTGDDDPWNRQGLNRWDQDTPAFKIIKTLATLRKESRAISEGRYRTSYVDNDILMFKRVHESEVVLVAVNRGEEKTISLPGRIGMRPGYYTGLLGDASDANNGNYLSVTSIGSTLHLNKLSSLVVHR